MNKGKISHSITLPKQIFSRGDNARGGTNSSTEEGERTEERTKEER